MRTMTLAVLAGFGMTAAAVAAAPAPVVQPFVVRAADGFKLNGQVDRPAGETGKPRVAVVMVAGTGLFDRDVNFGNSRTEADKLFKDLSNRFTARGVTTVRYDVRGVGYGGAPNDRAVLVTRTTESMRDDLGSIYAWARDAKGLGAKCVILFGHSEGMAHIGRLADAGAPAPLAVMGMGALLESPASVMEWQLVGRNVQAVKAMDANHDGRTTNDEVRAGFATSIGSAILPIEAFLHPNGGWGPEEIAAYEQMATAQYHQIRMAVIAKPDTDPYPDAANGFASWQWWKSWFTDTRPIAAALGRWRVPVRIVYGDRDSQTDWRRQWDAARAVLDGDTFGGTTIPDLGHGLGPHVTVGPMDPAAADTVAREVEAAAKRCR